MKYLILFIISKFPMNGSYMTYKYKSPIVLFFYNEN